MTFIDEAKNEILLKPIERNSAGLSFLCGIIKTLGEINLNKKEIIILTENEKLYSFINKVLKKIYNGYSELELSNEKIFNQIKYEIIIPKDITERLLVDCEIVDHTNSFSTFGIPSYLVEQEFCAVAFIKAIFLATATGNIVINGMENESKSCGYHLEFVFSNNQLALDFASLLAQFDVLTKKVSRKEQEIVYVKDLETICDILAIVGAVKSVLNLQNESALRSVRNNVNRQNNCLNANIEKTVNASVKQLEAIKNIEQTIGLETLEIPLQETCLLRMANPEESLDELVRLSISPISKSGLNHRLNKLIKISENLKLK